MARRTPALALAGVPRVNLMPRAETERRERVTLTRAWAFAAGGAVVVAALVVAAAFGLQLLASQRLAAEQARTNDLVLELAGYSDVSAALGARNAIEAFRADAMANDIDWKTTMERVIAAQPAGVTLLDAAMSAGRAPAGDDPAAQIGGVGLLTFQGAHAGDQALTVEALSALDGVVIADAQTLTQIGEGVYEFIVTVTFDQSIYTGDYIGGGTN